ncbi:MAG: methyl-accepting chemotaxis protein, partial [Acidimicrobiales bacterium]
DAYRLDAAVAERGVFVRNLLITGDRELADDMEVADAEYAAALDALEEGVYQSEGRQLLEVVRSHNAELVALQTEVVGRRLDGTLSIEGVADVLEERLTPPRQALTDSLESFVQLEERQIEAAIAASNRTVRNTTLLLVGLGVLGLVLAVGIGGWITRNVTRRLTGLALSVDAASAEILAGTAQQAAGAAEQAAAVQETVATVEELTQTADQSSERARSVADAAHRSSEVASEGTHAVRESEAAMADIREQVGAIAGTVVSLAERAQDISGIVRAVEELAGQIHLLALNAAIEAARAGEHGRGFSVVASEVRALADQSKRATSQITGILGEIQQGTNAAVMATERGGKSVEEGVQRVERTGTTIEQLADTVASSAIAAEQISASSGQQAVATSQISLAMRDLDETARQNAAAARQAEQAARDLNEVAAGLKALVGAG